MVAGQQGRNFTTKINGFNISGDLKLFLPPTFDSPSQISIMRVLGQGVISSAGRASALQAEGRRFDPVITHHFITESFLPGTGSSVG